MQLEALTKTTGMTQGEINSARQNFTPTHGMRRILAAEFDAVVREEHTKMETCKPEDLIGHQAMIKAMKRAAGIVAGQHTER